MTKLCMFNQAGLVAFREWLGAQSATPSYSPSEVLENPAYVVTSGYELDLGSGLFLNKGALGEMLSAELSEASDELLSESGCWTWLTAALWPRLGLNKINAGKEYYILDSSYRKRYRHLLWSPYQLYRRHASDITKARLLLSSPIGHGELAEQLTSRYAIWSSPGALELAARLYIDDESGVQKKIASSKHAGAVRDYAHWIRRVALNYDVQSIATDDLQTLLRSPLKELLR
jgi:hypothetical protein